MGGVVKFTVFGVSQPQGSKSAFVAGRGTPHARAIMREGGSSAAHDKFKGWRRAVADAARRCQEITRCGLLDGPIDVSICFYLPRPKSAPKRVTRPATRPDLDKLTRLVGDAITGVLILDDAHIVRLVVEKWFASVAVPPCCVVQLAPAAAHQPALTPDRAEPDALALVGVMPKKVRRTSAKNSSFEILNCRRQRPLFEGFARPPRGRDD